MRSAGDRHPEVGEEARAGKAALASGVGHPRDCEVLGLDSECVSV